jgi:hypothetical protein
MSNAMREKIYHSTALLITRSERPTKHMDYIEESIANLDD